ncbi:hypothetical protein [Aquisalinus flavus]|uniref:Uncharacterized protein n=1 Tax=Aquisalinus flavus TaxID=1526572 RepID=A0A8J2Y3Y8_9PROT|nr:hypothetical protein [Aquisalinus flavus]MBD0425976.1 hypothetical protein [Aquisalinus flavus]UNE48432.1 hypothetical protein FF099_10415 [Aquisalinus flavus]GGD11739.1 hypothetical protein GCM10011342_20660 [Aquisalinus flavus]
MKRSNFMAVLSTGLFAGGGTMVGLSFGIVFLGLGGLVPAMSGAQLVDLFPTYWIAIACTIIPVALTKTASLAISSFSAPRGSAERRLWFWAFGFWLVNCAITVGYHVQVVIGSFMGKYAPEEMVGTIQLWIALHWIRVALALGSFVLAILAVNRAAARAGSIS